MHLLIFVLLLYMESPYALCTHTSATSVVSSYTERSEVLYMVTRYYY
jgi:hypothetical protein